MMVVFLILFLLLTESAAKSKGTCFERNPDSLIRSIQTILIGCPDGSVIYNPNVTASSGVCGEESSLCVGRPIDLTVDLNECYWKASCHIKFPTSPIFTTSCVEEVQSLHVHGWKCIKISRKKGKHEWLHSKQEICGESQQEYMDALGVLVSHTSLPWNYDPKGLLARKGQYAASGLNCKKDIIRKFDEQTIVSTDLFDVDNERDKLYINGQYVNSSGINKAYSGNITVKFVVSPLSKGGSGFVACYKKIRSKRKSGVHRSACHRIITENNCPALLSTIGIKYQHCKTSKSCELNKRKIAKRCNNCEGVPKCNKRYRATCPACCPGRDILKKCKRRRKYRHKHKRKNRNQM